MQTIGERLEEARKRKGISIREAAEATKIRGDYLQKFENNQFDLSLAELYVRGFLRGYAQFLKLPADKIINDFNALGHAPSNRGRQPGREVYGRMDLSVASVEEGPSADSAPAGSSEPPTTAVRRSPSSFTRGGGSMQAGPGIDPALVFKIAIGAGAVLVLSLIIWGIVALVSNRSKPTPASLSTTASPAVSPTATAPAERTFALVALNTVSVTVSRKNPDDTAGEQLYTGTLARGQRQVVARPGPLLIRASAAENLEIEINGRRYPTGQQGYEVMELP